MEHLRKHVLDRRHFMKANLAGIACFTVSACDTVTGETADARSKVVLVKTQDRRQGVRAVIDAFGGTSPNGKKVIIKPNFNTADPTPGSTHTDTLSEIITEIRKRGGQDITIGESSGPPATSTVFQQKGILSMAGDMKV